MHGGARRRRERGQVLPFVGVVIVVLITFTSIALDLGYLRVERRDMQAVADVVALDVARLLDGSTGNQLRDPIRNAAAASATRNDHSISAANVQVLFGGAADPCKGPGDIVSRCLVVEPGTVDAARNFTPLDAPCNAGSSSNCVPTAVRVWAGTNVDYFFRPGSADTRRSAVAGVADNELARFRVGSSLVSVNPQTSSVIGQILNSIVPGASVLSYQGLANANVGLDTLGQRLGIPLTAASPEELANTNVGFNDLMVATAQALADEGDTAAATALNNFIALGIPNTAVSMGDVVGVESGQGGPGLGSYVSAAQLLVTTAFLADGDHFVTIPAGTVAVPGLGSVGLRLTGIEAPREGGNVDGASATTQQLSLQVVPQFSVNTSQVTQQLCSYPSAERNLLNALVGGVLSFVGCLLNPLSANLPLSVQVTGQPTIDLRLAEVTVTQSIDCTNRQVTLTPTPASVRLLSQLDLAIQATLGTAAIPILNHRVLANAVATGTSSPQAFTAVAPGTPVGFGTLYTQFTPATARVGSNPLGLSSLLQVSASSLQVLRTDLATLTGVVTGIIQPLLNQILGQLDTSVIQPLAQLLGLNFGGSDLTQLWLQCDRSAVQLVG